MSENDWSQLQKCRKVKLHRNIPLRNAKIDFIFGGKIQILEVFKINQTFLFLQT